MNKETKDQVTHYAFNYRNVEDVVAYNYLYQKTAVKDGVPADVDPHKHIRPVEVNVNNKDQLLYALESDTYYLEPPVSVTHKGNTAPIGYRIVGALFTPLWGSSSDTEVVPEATYNYIKYTSEGTDYYLNDNGKFVEATEPIAWTSDEDGIHIGDRYLMYSNVNNVRTLTIGRKADTQKIQLNNNRLYYQQDETTYYLHGTTDPTVAPSLVDNADGLATWSPTTVAAHNAPIFSPGAYKLKIWKRDGSDYMRWKYDNETGLIQSTNDGSSPQYIEISGASDTDLGKVIDIGLCNNDAIKFAIEVEDGKQALVQITLLLQALDPYIDKMDIVCTDSHKVLKLTQSFTADDFSVSGGKFVFYVPSDYKDELLTFTFSDLYSKYGDVTYYDGGSGSGRYHFVTSPYSFTPDNNGGGTYLDLYDDTAYDPDEPYTDKVYTSTAGNIRFKFNNAEDLGEDGIQQSDAVLEEYPFSVPIYFDSTDPGDPLSTPHHGANQSVNGKFIDVQLIASSANQHSGTYFVFTADETRWNIAPTTAWEHRFYAFYRMEIDLVARTFTPKFTVKKIYDNTFQLYRDPQRDAEGNIKKDDKGNILYNDNGTEVENSMYGLTLDVADTENGLPVQGYLTYQEIIDIAKKGRDAIKYNIDECAAFNATLTGAIAAGTRLTNSQARTVNGKINTSYQNGDIISEDNANAYNATLDGAITTETEKAPAVPAILKTNPAEGPTSLKQILYVDGTPLYAMLNSSQSSVVRTLGDLKDELADNALVFLPENTTSTLDNVAYIISDKTDNTSYFRAGKDIVLKDKQPFYSPYDIQIDAANYASYTRELTHDGYDLDVNATIMLPFILYLNNGVHTNEDNTCSFTVNQMATGTQMQLADGSNFDYGTAFFEKVTGKTTEANKPYMIHVESVNPPTTTSGTSGEGSGTEGDDDGEGTTGESSESQNTTISFIAKQKGALIVATPKTTAAIPRAICEEDTSDDPQPVPYCTGQLHEGESATAKFGETTTYNFTNYGSFSGGKYDRAVSENVFYFGNNRYLNLHTLWPANQQYLYCYPFRGVYIYTSNQPASQQMKWFDISFDEYIEDLGIATSIDEVDNVPDLMVRPGKGCITITAARGQNVTIHTANGIRMERVSLTDGETRIVNVPTGMYIVNNVKVNVK